MRYETIIIGGGLSGLLSGIALAREGRKVAVLSAGQSALHFSSGSFEFCSRGLSPLEGAQEMSEEHPYRLFTREELEHYAEQGTELLRKAGIKVHGSCNHNHWRISPIGIFKPAWLTLDDYPRVADPEQLPWRKVLLVNIEGYLDFFPKFIAAALEKRKVESRIITLSTPELETLRKATTEMRAANIARTMQGSVLEAVARQINQQIGDADQVLMPAVVGLFDTKSVDELRRLVQVPLHFIPTIPASVPGIRTQMQLCEYFRMLGGTYILGDNVVSGTLEGGRLQSITTTNHDDVEWRADHFILASGNLFSHGVIAAPNHIYEPIFGLDIVADEGRTEWYDKDLYASQPYMKYGVKFDRELHPSIEGRTVENLYVVGSLLAGQNAIEEGTGAGVAITTALLAADKILKTR